MSEKTKVVHEIKLDKSIIKLLWAFAVILLLNALPNNVLVPEAFAELASNPTIRLIVGECRGNRCSEIAPGGVSFN